MNKIKFRMLHLSGEWHAFLAELDADVSKEDIMKSYAESLDGTWFYVGSSVFRGSDWSCLTFNGV